MKNTPEKIAEIIDGLMTARGLNQAKLSNKAGVNPVTINRIMLLKAEISLDTLYKVATALDVSPWDIAGLPPKKEPDARDIARLIENYCACSDVRRMVVMFLATRDKSYAHMAFSETQLDQRAALEASMSQFATELGQAEKSRLEG